MFDCFFYKYRSTSVHCAIRMTGVVYSVSCYAKVIFVCKMFFTDQEYIYEFLFKDNFISSCCELALRCMLFVYMLVFIGSVRCELYVFKLIVSFNYVMIMFATVVVGRMIASAYCAFCWRFFTFLQYLLLRDPPHLTHLNVLLQCDFFEQPYCWHLIHCTIFFLIYSRRFYLYDCTECPGQRYTKIHAYFLVPKSFMKFMF